MSGISPKLPLIPNSEDGHWGLNKTFLAATKQNFKNLLLTIPGERVMDADFGVGLARFLFEPDAKFLQDEVETRIQNQLDIYLPHVVLIGVDFQSLGSEKEIEFPDLDSNVLIIRLHYRIEPFGKNDFLDITVE